eukprot:6485913-Amphidinium_carterae.3
MTCPRGAPQLLPTMLMRFVTCHLCCGGYWSPAVTLSSRVASRACLGNSTGIMRSNSGGSRERTRRCCLLRLWERAALAA